MTTIPVAEDPERSVTFALAAMIAEWATGRYPLESSYGRETASHARIDVTLRLRAVLEAGLAETPASRPDLASFL